MKIVITSICKNELKYLQLWYDALKDEVDYITVLDTGSTDGTYELLLELAKADSKLIVGQQEIKPWRFDKARQIALQLLPEDTDIFIPIDLDERFEPGFAKIIKENWDLNIHYQGSFLYIRNNFGHQFSYSKIYANNGMWHWEYPVHETLLCEPFSAEHMLDLTDKITLKHYQPIEEARNYLPLLELRKKEYPNDPSTYIYLAREYFNHQLWGSLISTVDIFVKKKMRADKYEVAYLFLIKGFAYNALHKEKQMIDCFESSINTCPEYRDPYVAMIKYLLYVKAKPLAREMMDKCIKNTKRLNISQEITEECWDNRFERLKFMCYH